MTVCTVHDGVGTVHDDVGTVHDGVGTIHDGVGTVHDGVGTVMILSRSFLLRMIQVSEKAVEKIKTRTLFSIIVFLPKSRRL